MHLHTRNVNTGFRIMVQFFMDGRDDRRETFLQGRNPVVRRSSRNGPVLMIEEPVVMTYSHPTERVLFNLERNANPFFHLYEALWMLAGRDDVAGLAHYVPRVKEYSDDEFRFNGAYGRRWRYADAWVQHPTAQGPGTVDQLDLIVQHLRNKPDSRRAVLQMWNVDEDLMRIGGLEYKHLTDDQGPLLSGGSKDVCCNTEVMFSLRPPVGSEGYNASLDMTVINRSNDLVWGTYGSDFMTFSVLQEYMAARLQVRVGLYHHVSNNLHAYENNFTPEKWLSDTTPDIYEHVLTPETELVPMVGTSPDWDSLLRLTVNNNDGREREFRLHYPDEFLDRVAQPMFDAYYHYRRKDLAEAIECARSIASPDWAFACTRWLERRAS